MQNDVRHTSLYREAEALIRSQRQPSTGHISDAVDIHASPLGNWVVFAGTLMDALEGAPSTRICVTDLASCDTRVLTFGPHTDRSPKFSPDGRQIAFLSDRHGAGNFQLYLLDPVSGLARPTPAVEGWIEYLHWSPNGERILLGVAGHGADISGGQGAITSNRLARDLPSWIPTVEAADENYRWRSAWVYEWATNRVRRISPIDVNVWEGVWCGDEAIAIVASPGPGEGLWYTAQLHRIDIETGQSHSLYVPQDQLGWPAGSPSGQHLVVVEAVCSDRWIVAGDLHLIDTAVGLARRVNTSGVDVTYTEWRSERRLLLAGHRGFETVIGVYDVASDRFTETWSSQKITSGGLYASVSGLNESGDCVLAGQGFRRGPEIAVIRNGQYRPVKPLDGAYAEQARVIESAEPLTWSAPDGLEIQGWLLRPPAEPPYPMILYVHGGPVWHWRTARLAAWTLMLLKRGYAIFLPNPRGSSGRGQAFARRVVGDIGGADTYDHLSGLDQLVERGIADPRCLGVTGGSYGGYMTAWLITQDTRFAAAVAVAPVTHRISQRLTCNHPHFVDLFVGDRYQNAGGRYFQRSPIMHAHRTKTPTLNVCGALDRCTPAAEAVQFHNALRENGVESVLVKYPQEGHGVRGLPAAIDHAARIVGWFEEHYRRPNGDERDT